MLTQAVFLVGGLGTRLKYRTRVSPKPLLEVAGRPFVDYLLDEAARHGFRDILLLAGYLAEQVTERYQDRNWHGARIRVVREPEPLGTGGALRHALSELAPAFLLANGDSFFDINMRALVTSIPFGGMTMALRQKADDARYGRVRLERGRVRSFHTAAEGERGPINGGIYGVNREIVEAIPTGKISLEADVFPRLAASGRIEARLFDGYFIDIGVEQDFERAGLELPDRLRRPAIFFDRDGVLNEDSGYVHRIQDFHWLEGAKEAVRLCNDRRALAFIVSNQAGVARGFYGIAEVESLHQWINGELAAIGAHIDAFEYCPHHVEGKVAAYRAACRRRKPNPGMILDLLSNWAVDQSRSFLIGNHQSDLDAASAAGIKAHLYERGNLHDFVKACLDESGA